MLMLLLLILLSFFFPPDPLRPLFNAILEVESGGKDLAVGDDGLSNGPYQIGRDYWKDGCEYGKVTWDYDKLVWSRPHCEQVMKWYWARHGAKTFEQKARMHNGGPRGHKKTSTLGYWRKISALLREH